jgi:hypothetical protein
MAFPDFGRRVARIVILICSGIALAGCTSEKAAIVVKGAKTEYHWTLTGTNTEPGGTGKFVKISGFEEWRFGPDGLIAESLGHFDAADYERQLKVGGQRP